MATPYKFAGVDPSSSMTGLQALSNLEGVFGRPLTENEKQQARGFAGYTDPSGAASLTGAQYNQILQGATSLLPGSTYTAWQAPAAPTAPATSSLALETPDAPTYTAPTYEAPAPYQAPDPFTYDDFRPTTEADLYADRSYQWRVDEGRKALEASAAAGGYLRTGGTFADLLRYGQNEASKEFANVDTRRRADYSLGYGTAADVYDRNAGAGRYAYEQDVAASDRAFDAATQNAQSEYAPQIASWQARTSADQRAAELNFDRDWQKELYERDDAYRRERAAADDAWRQFVYTGDDSWRKYALDIESKLQIASMGRF